MMYEEIIRNSAEKPGDKNTEDHYDKPRRVNVPGFLIKEEVGLGDVLKRVSHKVRFKPCSGCQRRAARLNRRLIFTPRRPK